MGGESEDALFLSESSLKLAFCGGFCYLLYQQLYEGALAYLHLSVGKNVEEDIAKCLAPQLFAHDIADDYLHLVAVVIAMINCLHADIHILVGHAVHVDGNYLTFYHCISHGLYRLYLRGGGGPRMRERHYRGDENEKGE